MGNGDFALYFHNNTHQEDQYIVKDIEKDIILDIVFDGIFSANGGFASSFLHQFVNNCEIHDAEDLVNCMLLANKKLYHKRGVSLSTVTASLKVSHKLYMLNAGDSPAYLIRDKKIIALTEMDRFKGELGKLTNAVGLNQNFHYHLRKIHLQPKDKLVIMTDGISDNISDKDWLDITEESTAIKAAEKLTYLMEEKRRNNKGRHDTYGFFKFDDATAIIRYFN